MARPAAIVEQAKLDELKSAYFLIARSNKPRLTDKNILQCFMHAVQHAVKLYYPQLAAQQ
jgi:hypothetical protein